MLQNLFIAVNCKVQVAQSCFVLHSNDYEKNIAAEEEIGISLSRFKINREKEIARFSFHRYCRTR